MDRNAFIENLKARLEELDNEFNQVQVKAEKAGEDIRHQWEKRKLELKEKRQQLAAQLEKLRSTADSHWEEARGHADKAWETAVAGLKDIKDSLFGR
ncbi:MAG: hypothetical protein R3354_05170 [Thiohalomonadales bacterium]|nr:hypothetical protein [Thiohalomonadales bacterium]